MRWLLIEAHFLAGRYHGRKSSAADRDFPAEWPPNPYRLFQALVAAGNLGFRRTEFSDTKIAALRWLERRPPPEIIVPPAREANPVRLYVPNNDMDKVARAWARNAVPEKQPSELRTDKDLRPHAVGDDATVRYLWPVDESEWGAAEPHAATIAGEARHLHVLGLGIDLVAGNGMILDDAGKVAAAAKGETWVADPDGIGWRVPAAGSLDELIARHAAQARRVRVGSGRGAERSVAAPAPARVHGEVGYRPRALAAARRVHRFRLVDEEGETRSFAPLRAIEVAAWLRHAAHMVARDALRLDTGFVEGFVCGHGPEAEGGMRFSYLPLPTIAARGRDGLVRRVLVAEPSAGGGGKALAVAKRLNGAVLTPEGGGRPVAGLVAATGDDGVFRRYLPAKGATRWGTVTPIVLPGRDDRSARKAAGLVLKALAQAGLTVPAEVALQAVPVFPGQETAGRYRVPEYLKPYPRTHAVITFAEPVNGPLALGGGRHIGLGLMAALD